MKSSSLALKYLAVIAVALALIAVLAAWSAAVQDGPWNAVPRVLMVCVVIFTGPAVMVAKKQNAMMVRSDSAEGIEREVALRASSAVFYDALVLITAFGASFLIFGDYAHPAFMTIVLLVTLIVMYFIRHAIILKKLAQ
ncbi:hypothetical protein [Arthrobacter alkaliphilus]|jgi:hypothetical protein|uniref:hypothetical protein n=1 Tax=Arthrobacter alkaliphilus TaxID=369936 RepID=UPI001F15C104|nr:hypothetical protein [Arthrobacter alkaliphilus]